VTDKRQWTEGVRRSKLDGQNRIEVDGRQTDVNYNKHRMDVGWRLDRCRTDVEWTSNKGWMDIDCKSRRL
jgi:hypothetical protein